MEVHETAQGGLNNLRNALNSQLNPTNWCYDWIKGSFAADDPPPANSPPAGSPADLTWNSGRSPSTRRAEGYALFWRNNPTKFTMVPARFGMSEGVSKDPNSNPAQAVPAHCLSLSSMTRDFEGDKLGRPVAKEGFNTGAKVAWIRGYDPDVSKFTAYSLYWGKVRRPTFCVVNLNNGAGGLGDRLCPITLFHAPSYPPIANKATYISGLSQELYVTNDLDANGAPKSGLIDHGKTIAAGDYNLEPTTGKDDDPSEFNRDYYFGTYWKPFGPAPSAGANCGSLTTAASQKDTTVQLRRSVNGTPIGEPIMGDFMGSYHFSPIDNVFGRGLPNATFELALLLRDMILSDWAQAAAYRYKDFLFKLARRSRDQHWGVHPELGPRGEGGKPSFSFMQDWDSFYKPVPSQGRFTEWRSAAEFVNGFVSDHMPVIAGFTW